MFWHNYFNRTAEITFNNYNNDLPALIMFSWTGSTPNDMDTKFELLKNNFGKRIVVTTPMTTTLFGTHGLTNTVNDVKELMKKENIDSANVIFYSGGGSLYYQDVDKILGQNVNTYFFDSAPVPFGVKHFVERAGQQNEKFYNLTKFMLFMPFSFYMYVCDYFLNDKRIQKINENIINTNNHNTPRVFINGKNDVLVPPEHLDLITDDSSVKYSFEESLHLEHDIKYPNEYLEIITKHSSKPVTQTINIESL